MYNHQLDTKDIQKVTALYCEGMQVETIAQSLSTDIRHIQQMIGAAEQLDYFSYRPILTLPELDPEVQDFVYNETLTVALSNVLKNKMELVLTPIIITPSPQSMFTTYEIRAEEGKDQYQAYRLAEKESLQITCHRAAQELSRLLFDGKDHVIGVNWGTAVKGTVKHIRPLPSQLGGVIISIISLFGDLAFHAPNQDVPDARYENLNSNCHVTQLTQQLGKHGEASLLNVPGFIPANFSQNRETFYALRNFLASHASYQQIFGDLLPDDPQNPRPFSGISNGRAEAKISRVDTIITGFGSADNYTVLHKYLKSWLNPEEVDQLLIYHRMGKVVGDIGGHLVAAQEANNDDDLVNFLNQVNRRLVAAQPSDFIDVAGRHLKTGEGAGVVGITVGARKAKILHTLLSWVPCPISRLIVDSHCALALLYLIDSTAFKRFIEQEGKRLVAGSEAWSDGTRKLIPV